MGHLLGPWHVLVLAVAIVTAVFYILTLQGALKKCSTASRTLEPGMIWLLLIPVVNLIWHFYVVTGMGRSLSNEFQSRNLPTPEPQPGRTIGLAMCICGVCGVIPVLGLVAGLAFLVLWIIYWAKVAEYSRQLTGATGAINPRAAG